MLKPILQITPPPPKKKSWLVGWLSKSLGTLFEREMSWYKLQGYIRYIIQYLCKTDLEQMIGNGFQQVSSMKIVHYADGAAYSWFIQMGVLSGVS